MKPVPTALPTQPGSDRVAGPAAEHLLPLLRDREHVRRMHLVDWDATLRLARQARILGMLAHRLRDHDTLWTAVPERVRGHLQASINDATFRTQLLQMELRALERALPFDMTVAVLKGAAYLLQGLPLARGRMPNDVDLLVARADLESAEAALESAGWRSAVKNAYDDHYYREWSHELPPLRYPGHPLEVDLHHTIAPITSRTRADDALLFNGLRPIPGSRYLALAPLDQVLHAIIHVFQDSELPGELRGLLDIDGLIRHYLRHEADWQELLTRAERHRASRLLWYALHYCGAWLHTPVPRALPLPAPPEPARRAMDWILARSCLPRIPDTRPTLGQRIAITAALLRFHRLRMPPKLLARHLLHKAWVATWPGRTQQVSSRLPQGNDAEQR